MDRRRVVRCNDKKILILLGIAVILFAIPWRSASADVGPKPSMEFVFDQEVEPKVSITGGEQLECSDAACSSGTPLEELGPQRFTCTVDQCSSMAYGYAEYHKLRLEFSDGVIRESNVFTKRNYNAVYQVTVRETDLLVKEKRSTFRNLVTLLMLGLGNPLLILCPLGLIGVFLVIVLILFLVRGAHGQVEFPQAKGLHIAAWVLAVPALFIGGVVSLAMPITVAVEGVVALVYSAVRKKATLSLFTTVLLVNLVTQPLLLLALGSMGKASDLPFLAGAEVGIWLIEAALLYFILRKGLPFREALLVSLVLNAASLVVGWVLPI